MAVEFIHVQLPIGGDNSSDGRLGFGEQRLDDEERLLLQRPGGRKLVSPLVPVARVGNVALFAMQVSMDPRRRWSFLLRGNFMCLLPVTFCIPPQSRQSDGQLARRF